MRGKDRFLQNRLFPWRPPQARETLVQSSKCFCLALVKPLIPGEFGYDPRKCPRVKNTYALLRQGQSPSLLDNVLHLFICDLQIGENSL